MAFWGFIVALILFGHFKRRMTYYQRRYRDDGAVGGPDACGVGWDWHGHQGGRASREAFRRQRDAARRAARERRDAVRRARREGKGCGTPWWEVPPPKSAEAPSSSSSAAAEDAAENASAANGPPSEEEVLRRARRRAAAEVGFYGHLMSYLGVIAFLALVNLMTTSYPWFLWPALGWGLGLFSHYMAVFGSRMLRERFFDPAVEREVRREKAAMQSEKQASIDELSSTLAHELRNPIAAAKSLVQQMGEDPTSLENVEYAKVALEEMGRVERSISHLLKYAKEEDYAFAPVGICAVVDGALTQMRAKLDAAKVAVARNYIGGPTVVADRDKLRQVFANILDNAIDSFDGVQEGRRVELFVENGNGSATVRVRDNGCGIPPERLERIFNPFFTTKEKGTGLGMAISKKIVEAHEGTIDVFSDAGRGTEFVVSLPLPR
jgi:signal transduction histidine kinase